MNMSGILIIFLPTQKGDTYKQNYIYGASYLKIKVRGRETGLKCWGETEVIVSIAPRKLRPNISSKSVVINSQTVSGTLSEMDEFNKHINISGKPIVIVYVNDVEVARDSANSLGNWSIKLPKALGECDRVYAKAFLDGDCSLSLTKLDENFMSEATQTYDIDFDRNVEVRTAFSPDGDGVNDQFEVIENITSRFPNAKLSVFNRWGAEVFQAQPYLNDWKGDDLPDGTYFFLFEPNKCNLDNVKSHLTILRGTK